MKRDHVQITTNSSFGLGSNNGATQLTPPQSLTMKNNVCHEVESPFKQHLETKFTLKLEKTQLPLEPDKFGELLVNANEKEFEFIQELDMQDVKNIGMRELINFDPYTIYFLLNNSKIINYIFV
jgi:hypothetical protein